MSYFRMFICLLSCPQRVQRCNECQVVIVVPCMKQEILSRTWCHSYLLWELVSFVYKLIVLSYFSLLDIFLSRLWFICTPLLCISLFILC